MLFLQVFYQILTEISKPVSACLFSVVVLTLLLRIVYQFKLPRFQFFFSQDCGSLPAYMGEKVSPFYLDVSFTCLESGAINTVDF